MIMDHKKLFNWATTGCWIINTETNTEYKYELKDECLFICFQGSSNEFFEKGGSLHIDWKQNFDFFVKPYKNMGTLWFAHRGFLRKWKSVEEEILSVVRNSQTEKICITGMSQGAAIAGLAYESIWFHFPRFRESNKLIGKVFGCPRFTWFLNIWKVKDRWKNFSRIENGRDIVTGLPPWWFGFIHRGEKITTNKKPRWPKISIKDHLNYDRYL